MRKELELIEKIEAWLQGRLSPVETQQFEQQLANDPSLQAEVELQRQLMTGIHRASLREQVLTAKKRFNFRRRLTRWGFGGLAVAALVAGLMYYKDRLHTHPRANQDKNLPTLNESGDAQWSDADRHLPAQSFSINTSRDTVIETRKGIVLAISAHTFLDGSNRPATGQIQLTLKEALDPSAIMTAGLSTRSGDQVLSTGGMFLLDARQQNDILHIDTTRPITAQIPVKGDPSGMQLYKGRRKPDGTIDWVEPRPLEHGLTAVNILTLDFYPPHYLDALDKWGYDSRDRQFTDSVYYSVAAIYEEIIHSADPYYKSDTTDPGPCGINPAKIKAIWSHEFDNTLIATREFQQRLQVIHHCNGAGTILDLYLHHLDWNLSDIDTLIANRCTGQQRELFLKFAARHDGKVNNASPRLRQLAGYYEMKARSYTAALIKTRQEYWDRQGRLDSIAHARKARHETDSFDRVNKNFAEELTLNLRSAYTQLGYDTTMNLNPPAPAVYTATIPATGWYNVDKAVAAATAARTTLDYTDSATGKKAIIRYTAASFHIAGWQQYDRLYVYLLPDRLSSFLLLQGSGGVYTEKLNGLIRYDLVCLGYKGEKAFYYHQDSILPRTYDNVRLDSISTAELTRQLSKVGSMKQSEELIQENAFFQFDIQDRKRQQHNESLEWLSRNVAAMIMPCYQGGDAFTEENPWFPGNK